MAWLDGDWSPMVRISDYFDQQWWGKLPSGRGVYRLVGLSDSSNFIPEPINRACGLDKTGTLYIGRSSKPENPQSLAYRLGQLVMTYHHQYHGSAYRKLSKLLAERFPDDKLAFSWELTDDSKNREEKLLADYEDMFGELPPLNRQKSKVGDQSG